MTRSINERKEIPRYREVSKSLAQEPECSTSSTSFDNFLYQKWISWDLRDVKASVQSHTRFYTVAPTRLLWLVKLVVSPTYLSVSMCVKEIWSNNSLSNVLAHTVKAGHIVGLAEGASRVSNEMASWPHGGHQLSCFFHPCHFKSDA